MTTYHITITLPEPDHHASTSHNTTVAQWDISWLRDIDGLVTAWDHGIDVDGQFYDAKDGWVDKVGADCVKLLAAIQEHRRYAAQAANPAPAIDSVRDVPVCR